MQSQTDELTATELDRLEPSVLELRLGELISSYSRECRLDLAESVVRHLEALAIHPEVGVNRDQQSALRGFVSHWRWLVEQHRRGLGQNVLAA